MTEISEDLGGIWRSAETKWATKYYKKWRTEYQEFQFIISHSSKAIMASVM